MASIRQLDEAVSRAQIKHMRMETELNKAIASGIASDIAACRKRLNNIKRVLDTAKRNKAKAIKQESRNKNK